MKKKSGQTRTPGTRASVTPKDIHALITWTVLCEVVPAQSRPQGRRLQMATETSSLTCEDEFSHTNNQFSLCVQLHTMNSVGGSVQESGN